MENVIKVRHLQDDKYQVVELVPIYDECHEYEDETTLYQGSLSDCEAFIRLRENGYM